MCLRQNQGVSGNDRKALLTIISLGSQVLAIALLSASVGFEVYHSSTTPVTTTSGTTTPVTIPTTTPSSTIPTVFGLG